MYVCIINISVSYMSEVRYLVTCNSLCDNWELTLKINFRFLCYPLKRPSNRNRVMDKTMTPSPWTTLMDYPNGLPKWTTLKWTTPKNTISDEYYIKKLRFYTYTARTCIFLLPPCWIIILNKQPLDTKSVDSSYIKFS